MTKINVFLENSYDDFVLPIDGRKFVTDVKKILKYFLAQSEIIDKSCLSEYSYKTLTFDVVFCDNPKIHDINHQYRQKDAPTDVITFALFADSEPQDRFIFDGEINLGEIFISLDKTLEQSVENAYSFYTELYFLVAHGVLHLFGITHESESKLNFMLSYQWKSMENLDVKVCKQ